MSGVAVRLKGRVGPVALDVAFEAPAAGITALTGPSGSGKTSLVRAIAGLLRLEGEVRIGDTIWQGGGGFVPTHRREIGYVFQEASLLPHLSVRDNLAYGARRSGGVDPVALAETVTLLRLEPLLSRGVGALSGGERQRVALGRALLARPRLLLMDEPLSSLDAAPKAEILPYLESLHRNLAMPIIYVSHARDEIDRLADRVLVLRDGRVEPADRRDAEARLAGLSGPERDRLALAALRAGLDGEG